MKKGKALIAHKIFAHEFPLSGPSDEDLEIIWTDEALDVTLSKLGESIREALAEVKEKKFWSFSIWFKLRLKSSH